MTWEEKSQLLVVPCNRRLKKLEGMNYLGTLSISSVQCGGQHEHVPCKLPAAGKEPFQKSTPHLHQDHASHKLLPGNDTASRDSQAGLFPEAGPLLMNDSGSRTPL